MKGKSMKPGSRDPTTALAPLDMPDGGAAAQHIKEGKNAINWTRLSGHGFRNNEVRLQATRPVSWSHNVGQFGGSVKVYSGA